MTLLHKDPAQLCSYVCKNALKYCLKLDQRKLIAPVEEFDGASKVLVNYDVFVDWFQQTLNHREIYC